MAFESNDDSDFLDNDLVDLSELDDSRRSSTQSVRIVNDNANAILPTHTSTSTLTSALRNENDLGSTSKSTPCSSGRYRQTVLPFARPPPQAHSPSNRDTNASQINNEQTPNALSTSKNTFPRRASRHKSSAVWGGIKECKDDPLKNQCRFCDVKFSAANTSNAKYHLSSCHPMQWKHIEQKHANKTEVVTDSDSEEIPASENETANVSNVNANGGASELPTEKKQQSLRKMIKRKGTAYGPKNKRRKILDEKLTAMIFKDYQPFSIVDDRGFQEFVYELDPRYPLPSRGTLTNKLLPIVYNQTKMKMDAFLNKLGSIAITFDGWTSVSHQGYLAVTGHTIFNNKNTCFLLKLIHTSEIDNTASELSNIITEQILKKYPNLVISCAVTDSGANMIATARELKIKHIPCYAHRLQSVIKAAILSTTPPPELPPPTPEELLKNPRRPKPTKKELYDIFMAKLANAEFGELDEMLDKYSDINENNTIGDKSASTSAQTEAQPPPTEQNAKEEEMCVGSIVKKCVKIAGFFNQSTKAGNKLKASLKVAKLPFESLSQDVETRWNSTLFMMEKIYKSYDCITTVLARIKHNLTLFTPGELASLPEIIASLEFFATTTSELGAEVYPSISLIIPFTETLYSDLKEKISTFKTSVGMTFGKALLYFVEKKLWVYETQKHPIVATILDPRFKQHVFRQYSNYTNGLAALKIDMKNAIEKRNAATVAEEVVEEPAKNTVPPKKFPKGLLKLMTRKKQENSKKKVIHTATVEATTQLNKYTEEPCIPLDSDPIAFWNKYPCIELREIALQTLNIPATSTPSERIFSNSGNFVVMSNYR